MTGRWGSTGGRGEGVLYLNTDWLVLWTLREGVVGGRGYCGRWKGGLGSAVGVDFRLGEVGP